MTRWTCRWQGLMLCPASSTRRPTPQTACRSGGGRAAFDAKQCAADNRLGHPVAVSWVEVQA